jgi:hypothetical protein
MFNVTMLKKMILVAMIFVSIALLSACGKSSETDNEVVSPSPTQTSVNFTEKPEITPEPEQKVDFDLPEKGIRPYAVMIDNQGTRVLPQGGLNKAQVIYEIIVEGGISRFMPVFWGEGPTMIGPVRSSRHYFLDYAMEHDAIYVHEGWSPMAREDIGKLGINNINYGVFWDLTKDPGNWQDTYTSMEKLKEFTEKVKYRIQTEKELVFKYADKEYELENGSKAEKIKLSYSWDYISEYTYDPEKKLYLRFRQGEPHMERVTDEQLTTKNIIIQKVRNYGIKDDTAGRQNLDDVGSGEGYFITNGKCIEITWSKASRSERTKYMDKKGNEIALNLGQTWVQIFPINGSVNIE